MNHEPEANVLLQNWLLFPPNRLNMFVPPAQLCSGLHSLGGTKVFNPNLKDYTPPINSETLLLLRVAQKRKGCVQVRKMGVRQKVNVFVTFSGKWIEDGQAPSHQIGELRMGSGRGEVTGLTIAA